MEALQRHSLRLDVTQVHQIEQPSNKRLKLTIKSSSKPTILEHIALLKTVNNKNNRLEVLCEIGDVLTNEKTDLQQIFRKLYECYRKEKDSTVKVKLISLLGELIWDYKCDNAKNIDDLVMLLRVENSDKALSRGLAVLTRIGCTVSLDESTSSKFIVLAKSKLFFQSHNVQRHCLLVLGTFIRANEANNIFKLIGKYSESQDARVRSQAFGTILMIISKGFSLPTEILYNQATIALKDDYGCVRREALRLIYEIGSKHPEKMISIADSNQQIRLIDDAFGQICSLLCDLEMHIRVQAAHLLGGMTEVSNEFLHQTLDKKLMSNMRRKKSLHERNYEHFTSGEWSTGKRWADDAPKEILQAESVFLMASGACGAFVQGLEDEYFEVRSATVDSMCQLAIGNSKFAITSLDFLVDMFNDEIEAVRLKAIYSLIAISSHIILREDQLEIMLSSLEDYSVEVREGLHLMLGACSVSTQSCLLLVVQKVLDVLFKYPQDKMSAYHCLQRVGQKHPNLCMSLTPQLLQDHPYFDSAEKDVEDPTYVCVLIMLFNAAKYITSMLSLFPETTIKHYTYLRDTMPNLVPKLGVGDKSTSLSLTEATGSRQFLETLLHNVQASYTAPNARQALLEAAQDNLARLAEIDPSLSGTANFTGEFLGAQLLMEQLQISIISPISNTLSKECINQLMKKTLKLQNLFTNLTILDLLHIKQLCLRASALQLIASVKDKNQSALAPCQVLLQIASDTNNFLNNNSDLSPDDFTKLILAHLATLTDPKPGKVFREILSIVQKSTSVSTPIINPHIKMCKATISEPTELNREENILMVTAGLIASFSFVVDIENLQDCQKQDLRIRIKYPDQNILNVVPRERDLKKVVTSGTENEWKLRTQVLLSHGIWTEAAQVEISLCLAVRRPGYELELCKPIKIMLFPKAVKRGV